MRNLLVSPLRLRSQTRPPDRRRPRPDPGILYAVIAKKRSGSRATRARTFSLVSADLPQALLGQRVASGPCGKAGRRSIFALDRLRNGRGSLWLGAEPRTDSRKDI